MRIASISTPVTGQIPLGHFTVLVGPNNVGKSQTLRDIHDKFTNGWNARTTIVSEVVIEKPTDLNAMFEGLDVREDAQNIGHETVRGIGSNLVSSHNHRFRREDLETQFKQSQDLRFLFGNLTKFHVSYLNAETRLQVASKCPAVDPHSHPPERLLQGLFVTPHVEAELQTAFKSAFQMDVRLDYSGMTQLALRVARQFGALPVDPRELYGVMSAYPYLDQQGDGFRSFVGVALSLLLSKGRIVLLDEPEAFLHPAQARQLGSWIAGQAAKVSSQIIIATHNANFLAGILSTGASVDIFRMSRSENATSFSRMTPEATKRLSTSPVLSSQRVLEAIFYRGVVVCEADADRSVYQTVAVRNLNNSEVLFIHAHNKQTIPQVAELLSGAKIPFCVVVDLDAVNSHEEFKKLAAASELPEEKMQKLLSLRDEVANKVVGFDDNSVLASLTASVREFCEQLAKSEHKLAGARGALNRLRKEATEWHQIKKDGLDAFPTEVRGVADELVRECARNGLFLVPVGELEGWMDLGTRRKNEWIVRALTALHAEPGADTALREFVSGMLKYLGAEVHTPTSETAAIAPV